MIGGELENEFDVREPPSPVTPEMIKLILDKKIKQNKTHFLIEFAQPQEFGMQAWVSRDFLEPSRDLILEFNRRQRLEKSCRTTNLQMGGTISVQRESPLANPIDQNQKLLEVPRGFRIAEDGTLRRKRGRPPKNFGTGSSYFQVASTRNAHEYSENQGSHSSHGHGKLLPSSSSGNAQNTEFRRGRGRPRGSKNKSSMVRSQAYGSSGHIMRSQYEDDFITYGPTIGDEVKNHGQIKFNHKRLRDDEMSDLSADEDYLPPVQPRDSIPKSVRQASKSDTSNKDTRINSIKAEPTEQESFLGKRTGKSPVRKASLTEIKTETTKLLKAAENRKQALVDSSGEEADGQPEPLAKIKGINQQPVQVNKSPKTRDSDPQLAISFQKSQLLLNSKKDLARTSSSGERTEIKSPMFPNKLPSVRDNNDRTKKEPEPYSRRGGATSLKPHISFSSSAEPRNPQQISKIVTELKAPESQAPKRGRPPLRSSTPKNQKKRDRSATSSARKDSSSPDYRASTRDHRPRDAQAQSSSNKGRSKETEPLVIGIVSHLISEGEELYSVWVTENSKRATFQTRKLLLMSEHEIKKAFGESESSKQLLKYWKSTRLRQSTSHGRETSQRSVRVR